MMKKTAITIAAAAGLLMTAGFGVAQASPDDAALIDSVCSGGTGTVTAGVVHCDDNSGSGQAASTSNDTSNDTGTASNDSSGSDNSGSDKSSNDTSSANDQ